MNTSIFTGNKFSSVSSRQFRFVSSITESRLQVGQFILYFDEK